MRRGQAEIIGLVIVVLLLVFALIFFVKIKSSDENNESRLIQSNLRANSALNALMKVHVVGNKKQMKDLVEECIFDPYDNSGQLSNKCVEAKNKLDENLKNIFSEKEFHLVVSKSDNDIFSIGGGCGKGISASPFILSYDGKVEFKICT